MELKREVTRLRSIPNAQTNVDALMRMTAHMSIMEEKGIDLPGQRSGSSYAERAGEKKDVNYSWVIYLIIGIVIFLVKMVLRNS